MSISDLDPLVKVRIDNIIDRGFDVVIGDANGADTLIQRYLSSRGVTRATVFCSDEMPRNNIGNWPVERVATRYAQGARAFFTAKDIRMAEVADIGLMIWDTTSTGTLSNVLELLARKKTSVVFVSQGKDFRSIRTVEDLERLLSYMPPHAQRKADEKIRLFDRIGALRHEQRSMFD
ncbi:hypothetical protein [Burkholderia orbicola]|uniref:hypothetical protein n=1 Tax=Burkholderia orbicola TaxID=2978683 RepID=UPI002FE3BA47